MYLTKKFKIAELFDCKSSRTILKRALLTDDGLDN